MQCFKVVHIIIDFLELFRRNSLSIQYSVTFKQPLASDEK